MSAWNCIRKSLAAAPPSTRSARSGTPGVGRHAPRARRGSGRRSPRAPRATRCARGGAAREPDDGAARVRVPVRRAEPDEGRHEVDAAGVRRPTRASASRLGRAARCTPSPSRSHWTAAPAMNTLPSSAYVVRAADAPGDRREQPVARRRPASPGVEQQEAAGAVGVLRAARRRSTPARTAPPADRPRCRRSARRAGSQPRSPVSPKTPRGAAITRAAPRAARRAAPASRRPSRPVWRFEAAACARRWSTSVACTAPAGELPEEPRVDGAEGELAALGPRARARDVVEEPARSWCRRSTASSTSPVRSRTSGSAPSASQRVADRPPCAGTATRSRGGSGAPVARSHTTVVSRWLVMPTAAISPPSTRASASAGAPPRPRVARSPRGRARPSPAADSAAAAPRSRARARRPSASTTSAVEPVVPWSSART